MNVKERLLDAFPHLADREPRLTAELVPLLTHRRLEKGSYVFHEGDECAGIAFVLEGRIRVYKTGPTARQVTLYGLGRGEICILNAACVLSQTAYPADAVCVEDVEGYLLPAAEFRRLVDKYPQMRELVTHGLSERLFGIVLQMEDVLFRRLDERLESYLEEHASDGVVAASHQAIANDLGTSREAVSRLLADWERRGKVSLGRNRVAILDFSQ